MEYNWKFTSDELNEKLYKVADMEDIYNIDNSGKSIFYWGWYWRNVDFDNSWCFLCKHNGKVGFIENNKWDYISFVIGESELKKLRYLLEQVVLNPTYENFKHVHNYMNKLGEGQEEGVYSY